MVCYVIICSILNHILDFSYSGERIYFGFIEERYEENIKRENFYTDICLTFANRLKTKLFTKFLYAHLEYVLDEFVFSSML